MYCLTSLSLILAACALSVNAFRHKAQPNPNQIDKLCVAEHCAFQMMKALANPTFQEQIKCQDTCTPLFYNDTTDMKLHYQNCTTKCALTYDCAAGDEFMACAFEHNCMQFAPLGNATCPKPEVDPEANLAALDGEWWQQYGKNALWDCYPCQHVHQNKLVNDTEFCAKTVGPDGPVKAPCYSYHYSYDLFLEKGMKYFEQTWQLPNSPKGEPIDIYYLYMGSSHNETWYILSFTDRYVVLVDCSYMSGWTNVGSILWVRPEVTLTDKEMTDIAAVYKAKLGWNFPEDFCEDKHGKEQCTEPSSEGYGSNEAAYGEIQKLMLKVHQ